MFNGTVKTNVINTARRADMPSAENGSSAYVREMHYHDELEFLVIYEGEIACSVYGKEYIGKAGEVIFVNSRVPHFIHETGSARVGMLQFKESGFVDTEASKIIKYSLRFKNRVLSPANIFSSEELFSALDLILHELEEKDSSYDFFVRSGVYRALGFLYRAQALSDSKMLYNTREVQKILPILSYINQNYRENLSLESVSGKLGFDQSYFCRIFKNATGATFTEYLNFVRICKAEKLLVRTKDSIFEISEAVGFSSVSYFNRIFKKYVNFSPRTYRTLLYGGM